VISSLITLPVRLGLRGAQPGLQLTAAATDHALGIVGAVADAADREGTPGLDLKQAGRKRVTVLDAVQRALRAAPGQ